MLYRITPFFFTPAKFTLGAKISQGIWIRNFKSAVEDIHFNIVVNM